MTDPSESGKEGGRFLTVAGPGEATIVVRGSEFVGHAAPARRLEEAEAVIESVEAAHPDATHVVTAYRVGEDGLLREHHDDADEPTGSAGNPALTVLSRRGVEDVVVAIARYYGGTDLGVGGLARAYADVTSRAVDAAGVIESVPHRLLSITVDYDDSGTARGILESEGVAFEADYDERVTLDASVPAETLDRLRERVMSATGGRADLEEG